ncbi:Vacuolar ATP synthase subunit A isoform 3 [Hibiscus syriacus]|uniref:Vacuolar ATP synthase subunit A isoform 3 n=1 Tax=Hibiscus syriacus TaxID=106335 RepID=A0A6A2YGN6_HIBSY|nr:Vacuolar ATP synthase subunit A isoform 3 [Hibiscus syriacus]
MLSSSWIALQLYWFEAFKVLAKNYLDIGSHQIVKENERLLEETNMTPIDVTENLMLKLVDDEEDKACLKCLIKALKADNEKYEKATFFSLSTFHVDIQVSGPDVVADGMAGAAMYELVRVGHDNQIDEIIQLEGDSATIQVYEETAGLIVNDPVLCTHKPLSVELGPGILGNILETSLMEFRFNHTLTAEFQPKKIGEGDLLTGGDLYATEFENTLMQHHVALPPDATGKITYIAPPGQYSLKAKLSKAQGASRCKVSWSLEARGT